MPIQTVFNSINRLNELNRNGRRPGSGKKTPLTRNHKIIKKRVMQNSRISMRKVADINKSPVKKKTSRHTSLKTFSFLTNENFLF